MQVWAEFQAIHSNFKFRIEKNKNTSFGFLKILGVMQKNEFVMQQPAFYEKMRRNDNRDDRQAGRQTGSQSNRQTEWAGKKAKVHLHVRPFLWYMLHSLAQNCVDIVSHLLLGLAAASCPDVDAGTAVLEHVGGSARFLDLREHENGYEARWSTKLVRI